MQHNITTWFRKAFNTSSLHESRRPWVDYLKGIAIMLVVYRHVFIGIERSGIAIPLPLVYANMIFFSFRMPLFFILSGLFISKSLAKRSVPELINLKVDKLMYPYIIWSVIQVSIQILVPYLSIMALDNNFINAQRDYHDYLYILYDPIRIDQFWYFPALFIVTVVFILIKTRLKPPVWAHLLFGLAVYFLAPKDTSISILTDWMHFYLFFVIGDALSEILLRESTAKLFLRNLTLIIVLPLFLLTQYYYLTYTISLVERLPVVFTGCFLMLIVSFRLQKANIFQFLRILGYHSIYIYVMHVIASATVRIVLNKLFHLYDPTLLLVSGIFFGIVIPIIAYNLVLKKHAWFLFSARKPEADKKAVSITG